MKELIELLENDQMRYQMVKQRDMLLAIWKDVIGKKARRRRFNRTEQSNFLKEFEHMMWQLQNENEYSGDVIEESNAEITIIDDAPDV